MGPLRRGAAAIVNASKGRVEDHDAHRYARAVMNSIDREELSEVINFNRASYKGSPSPYMAAVIKSYLSESQGHEV